MISIPALPLALVIFWKEAALWYYHRTMPPVLRLASAFPGLVLGLAYLVIAVWGDLLPLAYQDAVRHNTLFFFFVWNGILLIQTRDQHNQQVPAWRPSWPWRRRG